LISDNKATLKENFQRSRNGTPKSEPPAKQPQNKPKPEQFDPLTKWLGSCVSVVFMSGRSLDGKLSALHRFDVEIVDAEGTVNHVPKHGIERVFQRR
jgi:hypothetical protein